MKDRAPETPSPTIGSSYAQRVSLSVGGETSGGSVRQPTQSTAPLTPPSAADARGIAFPPAPVQRNPQAPILPTPGGTTEAGNQHLQITTAEVPKGKLMFPEFDGTNPRAWIRRCDRYFEIYKVPDHQKMTYIAMHLKDKVDNWFDAYIIDRGGIVEWPLFCMDICRRSSHIRPLDIIDEFSKLRQEGSIEGYQEKFEELRIHMMMINSHLSELHFVASFVSGLKSEIKHLVRIYNPSTLLDTYEVAKLQEDALKALQKHLYRPPQNTTRNYDLTTPRVTFPQNPLPLTYNESLRLTYPTRNTPPTPAYPNNQADPSGTKGAEQEEAYHDAREATEVTENMEKALAVVEEEHAELSMNVALGMTTSPSTIKIQGKVKKLSMLILVDSGSTHSFISPRVDKSMIGMLHFRKRNETISKIPHALLKKKYQQILQLQTQTQYDIDQSLAFYQAAGGEKKRRIYGLGSQAKYFYGPNLRASSGSDTSSSAAPSSAPMANLDELVKH
ncbi:hypothetical protein A4A49_06904 [Nicotiana attenuata]|uniref:Ty3 transposon capsid-like protein domain-containing protein n=1 Tax=Nicotiana attenuata TaxID=49451 RepID=A0A1J6IDI1_NICAT|nr:hypothetical protein A4A49_06904 [Nicotiana attenuata]